jgi:signal peptidase I
VTPDPPRPDRAPPPPDDRTPEERADALADDLIGEREDPSDPFDAAATQEALESLRAEAAERDEKEDATRSFWRELPILILVALVVAVLIKTFLVQAFYIPSGSMEETLMVGDRVMVNKLSYVFGSPGRGDVVVFDNPNHQGESESLLSALLRHVGESLGISSPDAALIKRVIAVGGETVEIRDNRVLVDGSAIEEPYIGPEVRMGDFGPEEIPEGYVFVMGDNRSRGGSHDSRAFGPIPEDDIVGRAFVIVWPASRWSGL